MKKFAKFLTVLFFCTFRLVSQAQESSLPKGFTTGDNVWIVRTGVSLNNVSGSGVEETKAIWMASKGAGEFKNALGGTMSFGLYCPLAPSQFYYGINVSTGMRGFRTSTKWKDDISNMNSQTTRLTAFNAQISPTNVGYIAKISDNAALDFHVGTFFSCDFAGSVITEVDYSNNTKNRTSIDINDDEDYEKYDIGVIGGIGLWINHWGIELNYQRGIATMDKGGVNLYSNKILFTLGYAF